MWRGNVDEKKSEGLFFHVLSTKLCLTFEFSPRLTSIKPRQITLKGLELPAETSACHETGFLYCSRHEKIWRRDGWKGGDRELAEEQCGLCVTSGQRFPV